MEGKKPRKSKKNQNWTPTPIEDDAKPVSGRRTLKHKHRLSVRKKRNTLALEPAHLGVNEDDHMNDSWESGRESA